MLAAAASLRGTFQPVELVMSPVRSTSTHARPYLFGSFWSYIRLAMKHLPTWLSRGEQVDVSLGAEPTLRPYDDAMAIGMEVENPQEATPSEDGASPCQNRLSKACVAKDASASPPRFAGRGAAGRACQASRLQTSPQKYSRHARCCLWLHHHVNAQNRHDDSMGIYGVCLAACAAYIDGVGIPAPANSRILHSVFTACPLLAVPKPSVLRFSRCFLYTQCPKPHDVHGLIRFDNSESMPKA